jgi:DNA-binding NtrC family response regulator
VEEDPAQDYDDATLETETKTADTLSETASFGSIQTLDSAFAKVLAQVEPIAKQDLSVLLLGESGTGKEHLAKAIHAASRRARGPFVAVNSSSLTDSLVESRLFGHKKGSFTGADRDRAVDVRVIAATRRDVRALMHEGKLREDLYFRLAELTVTFPALRERLVDLPLLTQALLDREACDKPLTKPALDRLRRQPWPGNIRELRNALRRAIAASGERRTLAPDLFEHLDTLGLPRHRDRAPFEFPELVEGIALEALDQGALPLFPAKSQYEQRALQRAALLHLSEIKPTLPTGFTVPWQRLFAPRPPDGTGSGGLTHTRGLPDPETVTFNDFEPEYLNELDVVQRFRRVTQLATGDSPGVWWTWERPA